MYTLHLVANNDEHVYLEFECPKYAKHMRQMFMNLGSYKDASITPTALSTAQHDAASQVKQCHD